MNRLILDLNKISYKNNDTNFFLDKFYLHLLKSKKKFNFVILNKNDISLKKQISQLKIKKKIYNILIRELTNKLNSIHNINWRLKTWDFLLGHWLDSYISVILDRFEKIKPIFNRKINISNYLFLGKSASLITNDLTEFNYFSSTISWNKKITSRLLYLVTTKNFNNKFSLLNSIQNYKIKQYSYLNSLFFNFKLILLDFLYFFIRLNSFIFYKSYIKDKLTLLKIMLNLKTFPIPYSLSFLDNRVVKSKINLNLRKKINLNYENETNLCIKIIKFLLPEMLPLIYLEGFDQQKKISEKCFLPKKVNGIFTCSTHKDNSFKFWLADKIQSNVNIFFGTHGVGYQMKRFMFHREHEIKFSKKYFVWGEKKFNKKMISIGNFLVNFKNRTKITQNKNKFLLILHVLEFYKTRSDFYFPNSRIEDLNEIQKFLNCIKFDVKKKIEIRPHPKKKELSLLNYLNFDKKIIKILNSRVNIEKKLNDYSLLIFPYLSTLFTSSLSLNKPCMIYLNKSDLKIYSKTTIKNFYKLHSVGILHFSGVSLAKKLNEIQINIDKWWNDHSLVNVKKEFCHNYCGSDFNYKKMLTHLKS